MNLNQLLRHKNSKFRIRTKISLKTTLKKKQDLLIDVVNNHDIREELLDSGTSNHSSASQNKHRIKPLVTDK